MSYASKVDLRAFSALFYHNLLLTLCKLQSYVKFHICKTFIIMNNGKISQFFKDNWRSIVFGVAIFVGIFCGIWACQKSTPIDIDARRNNVTISFSKQKTK